MRPHNRRRASNERPNTSRASSLSGDFCVIIFTSYTCFPSVLYAVRQAPRHLDAKLTPTDRTYRMRQPIMHTR